jgi:hypothetical protein
MFLKIFDKLASDFDDDFADDDDDDCTTDGVIEGTEKCRVSHIVTSQLMKK